MSTTTAHEIGTQHKHWFRDIDRWEAYLGIWQKESHNLKQEYRKVLKRIEQHSDELEELCGELGTHRHMLIADERASVGHPRSDGAHAELCKSHATNSSRHEDLYNEHERLKKIHHTLTAGLALLKHEPYREE